MLIGAHGHTHTHRIPTVIQDWGSIESVDQLGRIDIFIILNIPNPQTLFNIYQYYSVLYTAETLHIFI